MDRRGAAEHRAELVAPVAGSVLEIGAGAGATFAYYASTVQQLVAVEPDRELLAAARVNAVRSPIPIQVTDGSVNHLPDDLAELDWVVSSLVLCTVPDPVTAVARIAEVLRPGGGFAFYEHVHSTRRGLAAAERVAAPVWAKIAGGCRLDRDTEATIRDGGLRITSIRRFSYRPFPASPRIDHILGVARRPE